MGHFQDHAEVLGRSIERSGKPIKQIAHDMAYDNSSVLYRFINPNEQGYNLPITRVGHFDKATGNHGLIHRLAADCGGSFHPDIHLNLNDPLHISFGHLLKEAGELTSQFGQAISTDSENGQAISQAEATRLLKEAEDLEAVLRNMKPHLRSLANPSGPNQESQSGAASSLDLIQDPTGTADATEKKEQG